MVTQKNQTFQVREYTYIRLPDLKRMLAGLKPTVGTMVFTKDTLRVLQHWITGKQRMWTYVSVRHEAQKKS